MLGKAKNDRFGYIINNIFIIRHVYQHVYYKIIIIKALSIVYIAYFLTFQCNGKEICRSHLEGLYCRDSGANRDAPGLAMVQKLKYEDIHLSSFSKMRVDLAAQVCKILHRWSAFLKLYNNYYVVIIGFTLR